uniref:TBC1 domain family member 2B n=1 Tax=Caenorhabditis japonica TaxID=281687 RepID=A0A8R1I561_CAEJA
MSATSTISPPARELKTTSICGYLHRVEVRSIGLVTRRRYWFALCDTTPYLYWYKESDDVKCIGRVSLSGAAFTYDPREKGRSNNEVIVLESASDKQRNEWMKALQSTRKRSWKTAKSKSDSNLDISSLTGRNSSAVFEDASSSPSPVPPPRSPKPKKRTAVPPEVDAEIQNVENVVVESEDVIEVPTETEETDEKTQKENDRSTTEWYLNPNGQLNERSLQMPKSIESPESVLKRFADHSIEAPIRAIRRNLSSWKSSGSRQNTVDEPVLSSRKGTVSSEDLTPEEKVIELSDKVSSLEEVVESLRAALLLSQRSNEALKKLEEMGENKEEMREYLLEKERQVTELHLSNSTNARRVQDLEDQNLKLEDTINDLQQSVEAFRESLRTKEELILRMCEEENREDVLTSGVVSEKSVNLSADANGLVSDVEVPEGILVDVTSLDFEEATRRVLDEENVKDIGELQDLVEGYRTQNQFLNAEIVELHNIIQSLETREKSLIRQNFDLEACYYQLKSRYLMVLNHFKSPTKPGKIMEPGVLKELLEESARTPRESQQNLTDQLGFYKKDAMGMSDDLLDTATFYMKKAEDIVEATKLEQSEEYMKWLQSWDSFLVNNTVSSKIAIMSSPDLKTLIRTGVPPAYRGRVWKSIVTHWVKDKQAELGNGYYQSMLKKASVKKQDGSYDAAIKQIDLDLSRTLPTNKNFDEPDSANIEKLRNVLYAFRYHNSHVGYCQGLNRLAAIALLYLDEQDAFWFLIACVEHLQPEGYYTSSLIGAVADQKVLRDLVAEKLPKLAAHLRSLEVDLSLFALCWFLTCFVDVLPHSIYLTIFDAFLYEGNKVLFRFALALLKICEPQVLQCKTIGTVHQCLSKAQEHITDFKSLAQVAFNELNPFPQKTIETKRQLYVAQLKDTGHCM